MPFDICRPAAVAVTLCTLLGSASAVAAEGDASADPNEHAANDDGYETVITASRSPEDVFSSERAVDVVTAGELGEAQPRTTPEALRESPGVFVQQTNPGGGSPIVRGMVGPQNLLLLDGIRLNNSVYRAGPLQYLNLIDAFSLDRIEVVRGPGSVLYGSDALGATINAIHLEPRDRREQGFGLGSGLLGRFGSAALEKTGHALFDLGGGWLGANAQVTARDFDDLEGGRGVGVQTYSGYSQVNASTRIVARPGSGAFEDLRLTVGYNLALMRDAGRADSLETKDNYRVYQNDHHLVFARGELPLAALATDLELTLSYQRFEEEQDTRQLDGLHERVLGIVRDETAVDTLGLNATLVTRLLDDRLRLTWGGELYRDAVGSGRENRDAGGNWSAASRTAFPDGSSYLLGGGFLQARGELLPPERDLGLALIGGYRFQHMGGAADGAEDAPEVDYAFQAHVFSAGLQGSYRRIWTSALTYSQGMRAPNLQESVQVGNTGNWYQVPNGDLGPERADTLELLTRLRLGPVHLGLSGYATFLSDLIKREEAQTADGATEVGGMPVVRNVNGGEGRLLGVEGEIRAALSDWAEVHGSLAWTRGVELLDEEDDQGRTEVPLTRVPPLFGTAGLRFGGPLSERFTGSLEPFVLFAGKQDRLSDLDLTDPRIPKGGTPGFATLNLRGTLDWNRLLFVGLVLENLTDARYKVHGSGVFGAGTNGVLTLALRY
jgi:outer membrane receptor protein involved in Fe transport